ncbi:MAG: LamG domain-containing protein [Armatimonadetes bacterium]|nr:LamG domain-containing protein [Armatimonadota bacterium]
MSDTLEAVVKALGHEPAIQGRPRWRPGVDVTRLPPELPEVLAGTPATWHEPRVAQEDGLVCRYDFDDDVPFAFDSSGSLNHGVVQLAKREADRGGQVLAFGERSGVTLPAGAHLFGPQPDEGTVALWVKPDFAAADLPDGLWDGYRVIFYAMLTDGNGLPDGWDEIGLFCHGPNLYAKCTGGQDGPFAAIPSPLKKGEWTHLCLTWTKTSRRLYVDGKLVADRQGTFVAPKLDDFPATLGIHAASRRWSWQGRLDGLRVWRRAVSEAEVAGLAG